MTEITGLDWIDWTGLDLTGLDWTGTPKNERIGNPRLLRSDLGAPKDQ